MRRTLALWLLLFGVYAATLGLDAFGALRLRRRRAALPARGRVARRGRRRRRARRVRGARVRRLLSVRAGAATARETEGRLNEPHGVGLPAADRAGVGARRREGRGAVPRRDRRAGDGARVPAGAARGAGPVGARRGARRGAQPAAPRLRQRGLPGARRGRRARGRGAAGAAARRARVAPRRVRLLRAARLAAVARHEVRAGGRRDRRRSPCARSGGRGGGRWRWGRSSCRCSPSRSTWASTRRSTAGRRPYAADVPGETATDAAFPGGYLERAYRLVALFLDRDYGLLRWAPVFALAFAGLWWLWRSRRDRLARAVPGVRAIEVAAGLCAAALGAQLLVAAFGAPTMFGFWFPPRHLLAGLPLAVPLVAWGLRHLPRVGHRARGAHGRGVGVALRGRALGRRLARHGPAGRAVRAAHRAVAAVRAGRRLAVLARGRDRRRAGGSWSCARRARRATRARPPAPRAPGTPGSGRTSARSCGAGSGSAPPPARCPRPRATA